MTTKKGFFSKYSALSARRLGGQCDGNVNLVTPSHATNNERKKDWGKKKTSIAQTLRIPISPSEDRVGVVHLRVEGLDSLGLGNNAVHRGPNIGVVEGGTHDLVVTRK